MKNYWLNKNKNNDIEIKKALGSDKWCVVTYVYKDYYYYLHKNGFWYSTSDLYDIKEEAEARLAKEKA